MGLATGNCSEFGNFHTTGYLFSSSGYQRHGLMSMPNLFPLPSTEHTAPGNCTSSFFSPFWDLSGNLGTGPGLGLLRYARAPAVKPWPSQGLQGGGKAARRGVNTEPAPFKNSSDLAPPFPWSNQLWASLLLLPCTGAKHKDTGPPQREVTKGDNTLGTPWTGVMMQFLPAVLIPIPFPGGNVPTRSCPSTQQ